MMSSTHNNDNNNTDTNIKNLWKMLDDMAENDPEAYEKFVTKNMTSRKKMLRPKAGTVLKGYASYGKKKVFINLTSHPAVSAPIGSNGKELLDDAPGWAAREIPLLVGDLRDDVKDKKDAKCLVVDVVFSPWVLKRIQSKGDRENEFKDHVANVAVNWVKDEHNLKISSWKYIKSLYKGGEGEQGFVPVVFSTKEENTKKEEEQMDNDEDTKIKNDVMSTPSDLLSHIRKSAKLSKTQEEEETFQLSSSRNTEETKKKKLFIQELDENGKMKKNKKSRPAVRKGFLHRKSTKTRLYSDEGSNEGAPPENPYPWANVVGTLVSFSDTHTHTHTQLSTYSFASLRSTPSIGFCFKTCDVEKKKKTFLAHTHRY